MVIVFFFPSIPSLASTLLLGVVFWGRAFDEALFSDKKGFFSEKGGGIRLVRISTGKAI